MAMGDGRVSYKHGPIFGKYWTREDRDRVISEVIGLFGGTCNGDILDIVSERSIGTPPDDLKRTIMKGAKSKLRLGSDEEQLHPDELRWLADIENDVVGTEPSHDPNERWRLRRNALMRRRFGIPQPVFDHDRMMETFGWCDPAEAFINDRAMIERACRLTDAAARCAEREGAEIASLLMYDPKEMSDGAAKDTVWECLTEWMDGRNRIPVNPVGGLATINTGARLDLKWRRLTRICYMDASRKDMLRDDVAWLMVLTRMERILGHGRMPTMHDGRYDMDYDHHAIYRVGVECGDILYDADMPEGFLVESLLAVVEDSKREESTRMDISA